MGEPIEAGRCETRRRRLFAVGRRGVGLSESQFFKVELLVPCVHSCPTALKDSYLEAFGPTDRTT